MTDPGPDFDPADLSSKREWEKIGDGSFGNVYRATLLGVPVAVKEIGSAKPDRVAGLKRDMHYLRRFPHPNVVQVFGAYEEDGKLFMVMELCAHSLRSRSVVNRVDIVSVLADVARALTKLHRAGHVHRDVKARNVLVGKGYDTAKLCDFGLARAMPDERRPEVNPEMTPRIGPPKYRAPEVVKRRDYDLSSDIYGFGVMCQQL
ncbi:uncharacterized protein MICPUCDRAFT_17464, partial [Micromonas pusilla CCMP1545]